MRELSPVFWPVPTSDVLDGEFSTETVCVNPGYLRNKNRKSAVTGGKA